MIIDVPGKKETREPTLMLMRQWHFDNDGSGSKSLFRPEFFQVFFGAALKQR